MPQRSAQNVRSPGCGYTNLFACNGIVYDAEVRELRKPLQWIQLAQLGDVVLVSSVVTYGADANGDVSSVVADVLP